MARPVAVRLLKVCVPAHVLLVVVPKAKPIAPVEELYVTGYVPLSEVEEILFWNVLKSAEAKSPRAEADAFGMLKIVC